MKNYQVQQSDFTSQPILRATDADFLSVNLRFLATIGIAVFTLLGSLGFIWYSTNQQLLFVSIGCYSAAIVLIPPVVQQRFDLFSTWSFAGLSIILGSTIRGAYISAGYPNDETLDFLFFRGRSPDYFIYPSLLLLAGLFLMAIGFVCGPIKRINSFGERLRFDIDQGRVYLFAFLAMIISMVCILVYVRATGGFSMLSLSKKRTLIEALDISEEHRTWKTLRVIASISILAHLLILADALKSFGVLKYWKFAFAGFLFVLGTFLPFYASSRGIVVMYGIFSIATTFYVRRRLPWVKMGLVLFVAVYVFQVMSVLRTSEDLSVGDVMAKTAVSPEILDKLVLNRNDLEVSKTAHIMNAIPDQLQLQFGKTIAVWLVAPIPREIWNSKPLISPGPIIGTVIYEQRRSGVPPGFVAEMFWNFHIPGVLVGSFLLGWMMRWLHFNFSPIYSNSLAGMVIYIYGPMQLGYLVIGTSAGYGLVNVFVNTLVAMAVMYCLQPGRKY